MAIEGEPRFDDASRFTLAAGRAMERAGRERFGKYGLTLSDVAPLVVLAESGAMTPSEILRESILLTSAPVVSHSLNRLEAAGFVRRTSDELDGRRVHIEITAKGLATEKQLVEEISQLQAEFFAPLSEAEIRRISEYMRRCLVAAD